VAVRATRAEHSRRFLSLNYVIKYVTTHLQEIPQMRLLEGIIYNIYTKMSLHSILW